MQTLNSLTSRLVAIPELIRGIMWMVFSGFLFVIVGVLVKLMESGVPAVQGAFIRYVFGMIIILPLIPRIRLKQVKRHVFGLYVSRALFHGISVMLWFFAMATIPLSEVTAIAYSTPIYTTIGAVLVFREHIRMRRVMAIIAGFVGILIILRPGFLEISPGSLAQVGAAMGFAASYLIAKKLVSIENPYNVLFMLTTGCGLVMLPGALAVWVTPSLTDLVLLFFVACFATLAHYAINKALIAAPLTATQPFIFTQMIWAIGFGYLLFGEIPDIWVVAGGLVILASTTYLVHRENVSARKQNRE